MINADISTNYEFSFICVIFTHSVLIFFILLLYKGKVSLLFYFIYNKNEHRPSKSAVFCPLSIIKRQSSYLIEGNSRLHKEKISVSFMYPLLFRIEQLNTRTKIHTLFFPFL